MCDGQKLMYVEACVTTVTNVYSGVKMVENVLLTVLMSTHKFFCSAGVIALVVYVM